MKIVNSMFSKNLGGIEQAFIDYTKALLMQGNEVLCITQPNADINNVLNKISHQNLKVQHIANKGKWDIFAKCKLSNAISNFSPDAIIAHGNRPTQLLEKGANKCNAKLISVAHNYKIKPLLKADAIFSITQDLKNFISAQNFLEEKIFIIPNMLEFEPSDVEVSPLPEIPTIGVMARFVKKKGVDIFLKSIAALKANSIKFNAIIAGDGEERENLQKLRDKLGLNNEAKFTGWAKDKQKDFYDKIDIFCLPSHHEPFGIVLLEAMLNKKPIVSTDSEGPLEILENEKDSLVVTKDHTGELAIALEKMIKTKDLSETLVSNAYTKLQEKYHISNVALKIQKSLEEIVGI